MFEVGDYIVCGSNGICTVENISTIDVPDVDPDRLYYILQPVYAKGSVVYIPIDNEKIIMRKVMTREQVNELIDHIPEIETIGERNDKLREERFKECMRHYDCEEWIKVIKTLYERLKAAEDQLYCEFSMALGIERNQVEEFIEQRIGSHS